MNVTGISAAKKQKKPYADFIQSSHASAFQITFY